MGQVLHGISRLADTDSAQTMRNRFKVYPIGYFHIVIAKVGTGQGKRYPFVPIDRTSKFAITRSH